MKIKMLPIVFILIAVAIYYFRPPSTGDKSLLETVKDNVRAEEGGAASEPGVARSAQEGGSMSPSDANTKASSPSSEQGFLPASMEDKDKYEALIRAMESLSKCLNIPTSPFDEKQSFNMEALHSVISTGLGEAQDVRTLWQSIDLRTAGGELRRLMITFVPAAEGFKKQLSYSSFKEGQQQEIQLSQEQKNNPTDTVITALESEGEVMARSQAQRVLYPGGSELQVVEKNGIMYSLALSKSGKSFSCTNLDQKNFSCRCQ